jgi:prephenate dehydrogenase
MQTVAIVGVGLIGGSFALALRKAGFSGRILGISSPATLREALSRKVIDAAPPEDEALADADVIYLAQPISRILSFLENLDTRLKPGALVTDAGSTKSAIVAKGAGMKRGTFLGGHPMAGKHLRGVSAADPDLFVGRTYFLTPTVADQMERPAEKDFATWLARIGAHPVIIGAEEHDRLVAMTSHLPQLLSTALAGLISETLPAERAQQGAGPGLHDMTRLAGSSWEIWADILSTNSSAVDAALAQYIEELQRMRSRLGSTGLKLEFEYASRLLLLLRKPS